ncbi:NAD-dependent epimerase/dehydratase family protein [Rhizobium helianthi]|uniref:NAD-dependent epimerase/dehydratase family protein n=1 Tax=Rhizobium helianthi TaxID=1132695 RepID=A0ABW4M279_9HYPH
MTSVLVLGGDGFCGWPTALHLSAKGYRVGIADNFSRRLIDEELGANSLTPIATLSERLSAWKQLGYGEIPFYEIDLAKDYAQLLEVLKEFRPDAVVHFAEQRSAPYSMTNARHKRYTVENNISATHNLLVALVELDMDTHVVHLGTVGVYGYDGSELAMPEGYLDVIIKGPDGRQYQRSILYPTQPGSIYHMTKSMDQLMFQFFAHNDRLRITDLHQGVVWGIQTDETRRHESLINRFDYDGDYGTVLNRFLLQAVMGHPLTVHGTGGQTRGFINIQDTVTCIRLAIENPPHQGDRVKIFNQVAETRRVRDLAKMVASHTGAQVAYVDNPRNEAAENELEVLNLGFSSLGLNPILLEQEEFHETLQIVERYRSRYVEATVAARSLWTRHQKPGTITKE